LDRLWQGLGLPGASSHSNGTDTAIRGGGVGNSGGMLAREIFSSESLGGVFGSSSWSFLFSEPIIVVITSAVWVA